MVGLLSTSVMMFADRLLLAKYSIESLTAASHAGTVIYGVFVCPMTIAGIAEVFVGQYHGHDKQYRMGEFAWQMLWLCIFLAPLFFLVAAYVPGIVFAGTGNEVQETIYFTLMVNFGSFFCAIPALMGYFAGQGMVRVITISTLLANIVNIVLDVILIYGWRGIPAMGIRGAAIGTVCAAVAQVIFFLCIFFSKDHRKYNGTTHYAFRPDDFLRCIKVGLPAGIAHISEMFSHMAFFRLMILSGSKYIIIASMMQSFYLLILFLVEGLQKAVTAIASNLIGAMYYQPIKRVVGSAFRLQLIFSVVVIIGSIVFADALFQMMISANDQHLLYDEELIYLFNKTLFWVICYFILDGMVWGLIGFLTAAGDTRFVMMIGVVAQWLFYFIPVYIAISYFQSGIDKAWMMVAVNSLLLLLIYYKRFRDERWKVIQI